MRKIAVINQKGGVGKTTTAANLSHALAIKGYRVTMIDLDPQNQLASHFGVFQIDMNGLDDILTGTALLDDVIIQVRDKLQLIPAGRTLSEVERCNKREYEILFIELLNTLNYQDFVFIDCPPSSGILIEYALSGVDEVLIPIAGDYLAMRGLSDLVMTLKNFEENYEKYFKWWIVVTRYHLRRKLCGEVLEKIVEYFPKSVLATPIREKSVIAEAPGFGKTVFEYRQGMHGMDDYDALAENFLTGEYYNG
jgi:chromosome partitioning protein